MNRLISSYTLSPRRVLRVLGITIFILVVLSLVGQYARLVLGHGRLLGFVPEFHLDAENNIPTYFSTLLLLAVAIVAGLIARVVRERELPFYRHWVGLALIFAYISLDGFASLHERLIGPLREIFDAGGIFYFAWVIPGLVLVGLFLITYSRFFWHLPVRWKRLFAISGALYVGGALGAELIGGWYWEQTPDSFGWDDVFLTTVEEGLEMTGMALFLYTLLEYLRANVAEVRISFGGTERKADAPSWSGPGGDSSTSVASRHS